MHHAFNSFHSCYAPPSLDYCCQFQFPLAIKSIKLVKSIQKVFAKRLCGPRLSHLSFVDKKKRFCSKTLERRETPDFFVL